MAYCGECGVKLNAAAKFCNGCGVDLAEIAPELTFERPQFDFGPAASAIARAADRFPALRNTKYQAAFATVAILIASFLYSDWRPNFRELVGLPEPTPTSLTVALAPTYDYVGEFNDGLATYREGYQSGYIDTSFKVVIPATYSSAFSFNGGVAVVFNRTGQHQYEQFLLDKSGNRLNSSPLGEIGRLTSSLIAYSEGNRWGYLNDKGDYHIPAKYVFAHPFSENIGVVKEGEETKAIDKNGRELFNLGAVQDVGAFRNGLLRVRFGDWNTGYVGKDGKRVIDFSYAKGAVGQKNHATGDFSDERAAVTASDGSAYSEHCGYIDKTGEFAIKPIYHQCLNFINGMAAVGKIPNYKLGDPRTDHTPVKWSIIDTDGKVLYGEFDNVDYLGVDLWEQGKRQDYWLVDKDDKRGIIDATGHYFEPQFEDIHDMTHGLFAVKVDDKWGVINRDREYLITPQYENIGIYSEGFVPVQQNGRWGFLTGN